MAKKEKKKNFCPKDSKVKLYVKSLTGARNYTYSFLHLDKKHSLPQLVEGMKNRVLVQQYNMKFQKAVFYDNQKSKDNILEEIIPGMQVQPDEAKLTMKIFDQGNNHHEILPTPEENSQSVDYIIGSMIQRIIIQKFRGKINAAMFYDRNKELIRKVNKGNIFSGVSQ